MINPVKSFLTHGPHMALMEPQDHPRETLLSLICGL